MAIDTGIGIGLPKLNNLGTFDENVTTTQQAPLGQTLLQPADSLGNGERVWIYVKVKQTSTATPPTKGQVVVRSTTDSYKNVTIGAATDDVSQAVGVAQLNWPTYADFTPAATELYGWVQMKGTAFCKGNGLVALDNNKGIKLAASGEVDHTAAITERNFGVIIAAAPGGDAFCQINCNG
jgi:hypothetical protein